ncbi:EH domain-containing protein 1 [Trichinella sp. T8]|nr:EH domain-containing protein 1 [Trichinella sp. T8]
MSQPNGINEIAHFQKPVRLINFRKVQSTDLTQNQQKNENKYYSLRNIGRNLSFPLPQPKMFSFINNDTKRKKNPEVFLSVTESLKKVYKQKLLPLEEHYKFHEFHSPPLEDPDFDAKPMILLVGQYSTGKTTFIRYLLETDFPGMRIGPEPTTDRFIVVMHGEQEGMVPGNALVVDTKRQFRPLSKFGNAFLNRFQCSQLNNEVLNSLTIVDTPGILSGEKQRIDRGYDFVGVLEWFAERLDISDEFRRCIEAVGGNEDKVRIVLNKADMVDHQQLMRVYGALMWSLGKVFRTPEVARVYIGSFWDQPLHHDINRRLFEDEQHDLFADLQSLPRNAALRKLNDLIKRARLAKVHAYIIAHLKKEMPSMMGKEKRKKELIQNLDKIYEQLQREYNISPGDFPDMKRMQELLVHHDFSKFNPLKPKLIEMVDGMLASDIARLMTQIPQEEQVVKPERSIVKGGAFSEIRETPFSFGRGEGVNAGADEPQWVVEKERYKWDEIFDTMNPLDGKITGAVAKAHMVKSKLPNSVLSKIWKLADVDKDGMLDADEFALANYLINLKLDGHEMPTELPDHLTPPSKRVTLRTVS